MPTSRRRTWRPCNSRVRERFPFPYVLIIGVGSQVGLTPILFAREQADGMRGERSGSLVCMFGEH